jgi:CRP/FNR family transcriptional regulator, anaerobic regulatory protein
VLQANLQTCIADQVIIQKDVLDKITGHFHRIDLNAGDYFTRPGKLCSKMAFISSGVLRLYNVAEAREVTLWIGTEKRFIADLRSFVQQTPKRWYIEAVTDCELAVISREDHSKLLEIHLKWLEFDNRNSRAGGCF